MRGFMGSDWAASTLKWWQEAGVDTLVAEVPRDWLNPAPPAGPGAAAAPAAATASPPAIPDTLAAFQAWLVSDDFPLTAPATARVPPAGDPACGLMILVDMPAAEDVAAGRLLAGEDGLFDRMIAAIDRSRETIYLASMSPVRTPAGTFTAAAAAELAAIARRHVALAAPKVLLLVGEACARALLGGTLGQLRGKWHELDTPTGKISTLVTMKPEKLNQVPAMKRLAWEDLKMLREGPG